MSNIEIQVHAFIPVNIYSKVQEVAEANKMSTHKFLSKFLRLQLQEVDWST